MRWNCAAETLRKSNNATKKTTFHRVFIIAKLVWMIVRLRSVIRFRCSHSGAPHSLSSAALCCGRELYCMRDEFAISNKKKKASLTSMPAILYMIHCYARDINARAACRRAVPTIKPWMVGKCQDNHTDSLTVPLNHQLDVWPRALPQPGLFLASALLTVLSLLQGL